MVLSFDYIKIKNHQASNILSEFTEIANSENAVKISFSYVDKCSISIDNSKNYVLINLKNILTKNLNNITLIMIFKDNNKLSFIKSKLNINCNIYINNLKNTLQQLSNNAYFYINNFNNINKNNNSYNNPNNAVNNNRNYNKDQNTANSEKLDYNIIYNKLLNSDSDNAKNIVDKNNKYIDLQNKIKQETNKITRLEEEKKKLIQEVNKFKNNKASLDKYKDLKSKINNNQELIDQATFNYNKLNNSIVNESNNANSAFSNYINAENNRINLENKTNYLDNSKISDDNNTKNCNSDACKKNRSNINNEFAVNENCKRIEKNIKDVKKEISDKQKLLLDKANSFKQFIKSKEIFESSHKYDKFNIKNQAKKIFNDLESCFEFRPNFISITQSLFENDKKDSINYIMSLKPSRENYNIFSELYLNKNPDPCNNYRNNLTTKLRNNKQSNNMNK